jgi:hypothetical protein
MKLEELKIYNRYKHINIPNEEFIYIGFNKLNNLCFFLIPKNTEYGNAQINVISEALNLDVKQVLSKLNFKHNNYYFEEYIWHITYDINKFKPILKDKLKNILNR